MPAMGVKEQLCWVCTGAGVGVTGQEARRLCVGTEEGAPACWCPPGPSPTPRAASTRLGRGEAARCRRGSGSMWLACLISDSPCALLESLRECQFNSEGNLSLQSPGTC